MRLSPSTGRFIAPGTPHEGEEPSGREGDKRKAPTNHPQPPLVATETSTFFVPHHSPSIAECTNYRSTTTRLSYVFALTDQRPTI
ncbi:hypothetical protein KSF_080510 [Reticulibacter mediterranei]|uniref:Uncharacterized protein n=1 Tax=Reticulibacter mediterranei TaxID=2778369 RepID=A0A8J3N6W7_9CHLR|nr:hypothetical protein KSF_080510 [Reticulibacter mediterranei]